jgi:hypothetical protein
MFKVKWTGFLLIITLFCFQTAAMAQAATATEETVTSDAAAEVGPANDAEGKPEPVATPAQGKSDMQAKEEAAIAAQVKANVEKPKKEKPKDEKPKPMFGNYDSVWGKAYLQYRVRPEWRNNSDFNSDQDDQFYKIGQRARIGLGLNYRDWLKVFVQVQDTRTFGTENTSISNPRLDGNTDLHQAWTEISFAKQILAFKIGRQQLVYGDQRLIGHLEWLDQGRVFDAIVFKVKWNYGQLDLFGSVFTPQNDGNLRAGATTFSGLYNTMHFLNKAIVWDVYLLGLIDTNEARTPGKTEDDDVPEDDPAYDPGNDPNKVSREIGTVGTRLRYNHKIIQTGFEAAAQFGYADQENKIDQVAGAVHVDIKAVIPVFSSPFIALEFNWASGDEDPNDSQSNKFNNLFPTNHLFYGYMDKSSWTNTLNWAIRTGFKPARYFAMTLDYWFIAKANSADYWYDATAVSQVVPSEDKTDPSTMTDETLMGHELDLLLKFPIVQYFNIITGGGILIPTYSKAGNQDVQSWAYVMITANY